MVELPTGTVTFPFTDIEGSTRLWQEHPEAMRPALARHDEIRAAIEAHDGHCVETARDGAHAVSATASDAIPVVIRRWMPHRCAGRQGNTKGMCFE